MTDRALSWGLVPRIVVADSAYGSVTEYREGLAERHLRYVVGIRSDAGVWVGEVPVQPPPQKQGNGRPRTRWDYGEHRPLSVLQVAQNLPLNCWQQVTWREGTKGPLTSRFAAIRVSPSHGYHAGNPPRPTEWLLIEWPESESAPTDFWLSNRPEDASLEKLVRLAKARWHIEQDYQQLKDELGLDHFERRTWIGWHRHVTLSSCAGCGPSSPGATS